MDKSMVNKNGRGMTIAEGLRNT